MKFMRILLSAVVTCKYSDKKNKNFYLDLDLLKIELVYLLMKTIN